MQKVCLIGSTKFKEEYKRVNIELSKRGYIVYSVAGFGYSGDTFTDDEKDTLDLVHLAKILQSDRIVICTDKTNYIGDSTKREIKWAKMFSKTFSFSVSIYKNTGTRKCTAWPNVNELYPIALQEDK